MKKLIRKIVLFLFIALFFFGAGHFSRPQKEQEYITLIDSFKVESKPDSGAIYAYLRMNDTNSINRGFHLSTVAGKDTLIDSLYNEIDLILGDQEIIADTKIKVKEGTMDIDYLLNKKMFYWTWHPIEQLKTIKVITIEIPASYEKKWFEKWYITVPIGLVIGYGLEKVL